MYPNIDAERARNGMTVEQLTKKLGVTRKTYYNWLSKGKIPSAALAKMSYLFGVSADYLLAHNNASRTEENK